jgi:hypothetical protein
MYFVITRMNYKVPFSRFGGGGGPNGPNIGKQLIIIFGTWASAKLYIKNSNGKRDDAKIEYKYPNPKPAEN